MKPTVLVTLLALIGFQPIFAQKQTNFWYFGVFAGLDFTGGSPVLINGATQSAEGVATISDNAGNLLFYTDGVLVWNKNDTIMSNGTGLKGDISTTQVMIVPDPGDSTLFYIFTLDDEAGPDGFNYSIVDMTLDSGNGAVSLKNVFLRANMSEKLSAVYHCNNHDIWVMAHEFNSDAFTAYLVTDNGISNPVISNVGSVHTDIHGQMKFTTDGSRLTCAIGNGTVEIFDFDNKTGVVSNSLSLPVGDLVYGIEFSPDNSKLYYATYEIANISELYQADLTAPDIQASTVLLGSVYDPVIFRSMQLGPDDKIYIAKGPSPFIAVINNPNAAGIACDFVDNAIDVDPLFMGNTVMLGLPGFVQSYFHPDFPFEECTDLQTDFTSSDTVICIGDCISFSGIAACNTDTWQWSFDGGSPASETVQNPTSVCYTTAGNFDVELIATNGCLEDTIVKTITVVPSPTLDAGPDVMINSGASTQLNATGTVINFQWTPLSGLSAANIANPVATPDSTTTYYVAGTDENGCAATDSVTVTVNAVDGECRVAIPDAFSPNNDNKNETAKVLSNCIASMRFSIFDRWGEKVFETTNQLTGWDGTYKGEPMPISTFAYYFEGTLTTGEKITRKGSISLIR